MTGLVIVVPVLNDAAAVATLIADLRRHAAGVEIVVVDGGSRDGSVDAAARAGATVLTTTRGRATQLRAGIAATTRPWIWMLHADCRVSGEVVAALAAVIAADVPAWGRFDVALSGAARALRVIERLMNLRSRLTGIATGDQGIFVHQSLLAAVGGVPDQALMEDVELSRRLKRVAHPLCLESRLVTSSRRWEVNGIARTVLLMWRLRLLYFLGVQPHSLARRYDGG